jgi:hypothetical protein
MCKDILNSVVQTILTYCPILDSLCALGGVIIGIIGVKISLPKITKQINEISQKITKKRFNFCEGCVFHSACISPHLPDMGDFDKINEIDDPHVRDGVIALYSEIKDYQFDKNADRFGSENHKECLLRKLTIAINMLSYVNLNFNFAKDHIEKTRGNRV